MHRLDEEGPLIKGLSASNCPREVHFNEMLVQFMFLFPESKYAYSSETESCFSAHPTGRPQSRRNPKAVATVDYGFIDLPQKSAHGNNKHATKRILSAIVAVVFQMPWSPVPRTA